MSLNISCEKYWNSLSQLLFIKYWWCLFKIYQNNDRQLIWLLTKNTHSSCIGSHRSDNEHEIKADNEL